MFDSVGGATVEYFTSRIPPPAHTSTANQPPPQQNGSTYFDFDRWNLPTPPSKIFSTQAVHQQHQGLMVPHPHPHHPPPPPLPYFPPFHLPPHPAEFELTSAAASAAYNGGEQSGAQTPYAQIMPIVGNAAQSQQHQQQQQDDNQPKVVVPNIEEELNFLSEGRCGSFGFFSELKSMWKLPQNEIIFLILTRDCFLHNSKLISAILNSKWRLTWFFKFFNKNFIVLFFHLK